MKFLFIDESERQQKTKNQTHFFCLCGLMIDEENLLNLENNLKILRKKYSLSNFKESRKRYHFKLELTKELYEILKIHNAKIISIILGDIALRDIHAVDAYFDALTFLIERFFINLKKDEKIGIIIFDSVNKALENDIKKKFSEFISEEEHMMHFKLAGYYKDKIYPSLLFSNDEYSTILQATDLIATALNSAVWKSFEKENFNVETFSDYNEYLKIYWPLFVKSPTGKVSGWGIKVWS